MQNHFAFSLEYDFFAFSLKKIANNTKGGNLIMKKPNNIVQTTGKATYKNTSTMVSPDMEQLYFELQDNEHIFNIGIKTLLECIIFATKENQLPDLPLQWYTEVCSRYDIPIDDLLGDY